MTYGESITSAQPAAIMHSGIIAGAGASRPGPAGLCAVDSRASARKSLTAKFNGEHGHAKAPVWKPYGLTSSWWLKHADVKATPMWQALHPGQGCRYIIEGRYKPVAKPEGIVRISRNQRYLGGGGEYDITGLCPGATTIHAVDRSGTCVDELQVSVVQPITRTLRFCYLSNEDAAGGSVNGSTRSPATLAAILQEANGILGGWTGVNFKTVGGNTINELQIGDSLAAGYDTTRHRPHVMSDIQDCAAHAAHVYFVGRFTDPQKLGFAHVSTSSRTLGAVIIADNSAHPGTVLAHELVHLMIASPADRQAAGLDAKGHSSDLGDLMFHAIEFSNSSEVTGTRIPRQQAVVINPTLACQ